MIEKQTPPTPEQRVQALNEKLNGMLVELEQLAEASQLNHKRIQHGLQVPELDPVRAKEQTVFVTEARRISQIRLQIASEIRPGILREGWEIVQSVKYRPHLHWLYTEYENAVRDLPSETNEIPDLDGLVIKLSELFQRAVRTLISTPAESNSHGLKAKQLSRRDGQLFRLIGGELFRTSTNPALWTQFGAAQKSDIRPPFKKAAFRLALNRIRKAKNFPSSHAISKRLRTP